MGVGFRGNIQPHLQGVCPAQGRRGRLGGGPLPADGVQSGGLGASPLALDSPAPRGASCCQPGLIRTLGSAS